MMGKNMWITGVQGFIGSALSRHLSAAGIEVAGIGSGRWSETQAKENGVSYFVNSKISVESLDELRAKTGKAPDVIFHLAGGSSVGYSLINPDEDFVSTVNSTSFVLEWLRRRSCDTHMIYASSAAVYGGGYSDAIAESDPAHPYSPYGWHKRMAEMLLDSYRESYGLSCTVLRLFSVYGEGLQKQLIWDVCRKLANGKTNIELGGTGKELRDWVHVDDVVSILRKVVERREEVPDIINIASGTGTPVADVVSMIMKCWCGDCTYGFSGEVRKGDPENLVADISLLKKMEIDSQVSISDGLLKTVDWYKNHLK